jgi:hypothetical protein
MRPSLVMERMASSIFLGSVEAFMGLTSYTQMERAMGFTFSFFFSASLG